MRALRRASSSALLAPGDDDGELYAERVLALCVEGLSERSEHHGPAESDARRKLDALWLPALAGQDDGEAGLLDATRVLMLCAFGGDLRS